MHIWSAGKPTNSRHRQVPAFIKDELLNVTLFREELPWLSGRDQELVMGGAACDWLGWTLPR